MLEQTPAKPWWRRWFGTRSERAAAKFLKRNGLRILKRNHQSPLGELDIVALDGQCIVFVEVRSTERDSTELPAASVGYDKQQRLTRLALAFLQDHRLLGRSARFDVLAISWPANAKEARIEHYPNAFEPVGKYQLFS